MSAALKPRAPGPDPERTRHVVDHDDLFPAVHCCLICKTHAVGHAPLSYAAIAIVPCRCMRRTLKYPLTAACVPALRTP